MANANQGISPQTQAKEGDTVRVHYTARFMDGTVFDSSVMREPLEFTIGEGLLIPGFEQAVVGMHPGESKTEQVSAEQAYGPHRDEMVLEVDRNQFPSGLEPEVGQQLQVRQANGLITDVTVTDVHDSRVTLDANHPLAGKDLVFDIQLVEIE
ncbi:MAG: peptidylprolyl isomerase [bacterium]